MMDNVVTSALKHSCLHNAIKSPDYVIRAAKSVIFIADVKSAGPIHASSTRRLIPLALNHLELRGSHFSAVLKEFATTLVT
jgi:hypothetical protein